MSLLIPAGALGAAAIAAGAAWATRKNGLLYSLFVSPVGYYWSLREERDTPHSATSPVDLEACRIVPIAVRDDNYSYLIVDQTSGEAAVVDPASPKLVLEALQREPGAKLTAILTTHRHWDHSGGNHRLLQMFPELRVYGSAVDSTPAGNRKLQDGETFKVGNLTFRGLESRVHTKGHLLYLLETGGSSPMALFSGDALFVGGAGKFFESTAEDLLRLAGRLKALGKKTLLFPGHEYTLANLRFGASLEPMNAALRAKLRWCEEQRALGRATVPSVLQEEFEYNPFLRSDQPSVRARLPPQKPGHGARADAHYLQMVRDCKDGRVQPLQ